MKKHNNHKGFYFGAFISLWSIGTMFSIIVSIVAAVFISIVSDNNVFWWIFIPLELKSICDSIYLTFTIKKDPWGKE